MRVRVIVDRELSRSLACRGNFDMKIGNMYVRVGVDKAWLADGEKYVIIVEAHGKALDAYRALLQ